MPVFPNRMDVFDPSPVMYDLIRYIVLISLLISFTSLSSLLIRTILAGKKPFYAKVRGRTVKGIIYALSLGLAPWEKESAARHLPTYIAGIIYHLGIFTGIAYSLTAVLNISLSQEILTGAQVLIAAGVLCGFGLLMKRLLIPHMRELSCPDDYISNILVNFFLVSAVVSISIPGGLPVFFISAILLFLYTPLGKIRHCFFFFFSRILFGQYYGKRGVLPGSQSRPKEIK